ncbi:hypothetical protein N7509_002072 [Penicillium cosmopolitanum]|uniref:Uncharacterized protein n=1 Tax=Penicillium cosmopolitanum TaxID=1131564 RepID=A0A9W9W8D3_9EURO|nr:uncharacterized protein N7509_002072 [Penicillium cosmopolitanum]KAJ5408189.1 hypothetical protein N7509_002072 [Penicillium cosmopolitanum]
MSSGLPTLNRLRKPELVEIAERTKLTDISDLNKGDLAVALDKHLSDNQATLSNDKKLADYFKRLAAPARGESPVKREPRVELATPASEKKTPGRKPKQRETASSRDSESEDAAKSPAFKTPLNKAQASVARSSSRVRSVIESTTQQLPPSPAIVTDAIDRQTARMREGLETAWTDSGVVEYQHALRSALSSLKAVETIVLLLEGGSMLKELVPLRYLTTTPAVDAIHLPSLPIKVPDLFVLLSGSFWAPFTLWLLSGLILPLIAAYFINLSYQAATGGSGARRSRSSSAAADRASFDPLTFNIAKALLVYKVYVDHLGFFDLFSHYTIARVNASVPGGWGGMLTGTAIGVIGTLYEAILHRQ